MTITPGGPSAPPSPSPLPSGTSEPEPGPGRWRQTFALGFALLLTFECNYRHLGQFDTAPTMLLSLTLARGDGPFLNRYKYFLIDPPARPKSYVALSRGRILSRYPVAPALVVLPFCWLQLCIYDWSYPGWEEESPLSTLPVGRTVNKHSLTILGAIVGMMLHRLLLRIGLERVAIPAVLGALLGSDFWAVGTQALWQHGPAAFALTWTMLALAPPRPSRLRLLLGGLATGLMVACRAIDVVFAVAILAVLLIHQPRRLGWFLPGPVILGSLLLGYNIYYFGALSGGQAYLETLHPQLHAVPGPWSGRILDGLLGTLFSPARGLFVYSPWLLLALVPLPWTLGRLRSWPVLLGLVASLLPMLLILSKYAVWWGGHCFGPRYWTDATPLFALILALGLDLAVRRSRLLLAGFAVTIGFAIALQAIAAFLFPSTWNMQPANVDLHHERLWDWRDTEISRCLAEKLGIGSVPVPGKTGP